MTDKPLIDHPAGPSYGTKTSELSSPYSSKDFTRLSSVSDAASTVSGGPTVPVHSDQIMFVSDISHAGWTSIEISVLDTQPPFFCEERNAIFRSGYGLS